MDTEQQMSMVTTTLGNPLQAARPTQLRSMTMTDAEH